MVDGVRREDGPAGSVVLTLDRPRTRNALDLVTVGAILAVVREPVRPVVLRSADPAVFSSGADLTVDDAKRRQISDLLYEVYERMVTRPGVVIAVVQGAAVGGGAQLSAAADLRVVTAGARWQWLGVGHGLAVGGWILPHLVGPSVAIDLMARQRWMDSKEAVRRGLATEVVDDADARLLELLESVAAADPGALGRAKALVTGRYLEGLRLERQSNAAQWSGSPPRRVSHEPGGTTPTQ